MRKSHATHETWGGRKLSNFCIAYAWWLRVYFWADVYLLSPLSLPSLRREKVAWHSCDLLGSISWAPSILLRILFSTHMTDTHNYYNHYVVNRFCTTMYASLWLYLVTLWQFRILHWWQGMQNNGRTFRYRWVFRQTRELHRTNGEFHCSSHHTCQ